MSLQVYRAKPNPAGKDKTGAGVPKPEQLVAEWVDVKNVGSESIRFSTIALHHTLYGARCESTDKTECYWQGNGDETLKPGEVLRVHTGKREHRDLLSGEDDGNVSWRAFAGRGNFVLNNRCGDRIYVTWRNHAGPQLQDDASYDPNPPEGAILKRAGNKLVPAPVYAW